MEAAKKNRPGKIDESIFEVSKTPPGEVSAYTEEIEDVQVIPMTGNEINLVYIPDVTYAVMEGRELHVHMILPTVKNTPDQMFPCVVWVKGSGWFCQNLYKQIPMLSFLAKRGYAVAEVEYRHSGIAAFPAQAVDAVNAVRFIRANAKLLHIDPEQILIGGDSSGGQVAMFAGSQKYDDTKDNLFPGVSSEVKGIIDYYGSVTGKGEKGYYPGTPDPYAADSPVGNLMGGIDLHERQDLLDAMSIECNISAETQLPPVLMFHGTADGVVGTPVSVMLYRYLCSIGKDAKLYLVENGQHGGAEYWCDAVLDIVDAFIRRCIKEN